MPRRYLRFVPLSLLILLVLPIAVLASEKTATFEMIEVVNQDGSSYDVYTLNQLKPAWFGSGERPESSYLGIRFSGSALPANAKVTSAQLVINNNTERDQWIAVGFSAFMELAESPVSYQQLLLSERSLTSAASVYQANDNWLSGSDFVIDVTQQYLELLQKVGSRNNVSVVLHGSGGKWARKFFYKTGSDNYPKLVITYDGSVVEEPVLPVFNAIPTQSTSEDNAFTSLNLNDYVVAANKPVNFSSTQVDVASVSIDSDGRLFVVPIANWFGDFDLQITVTDSKGLSASQIVNYTVTAVNDAPVFTSSPIITTNDGALYQYELTAIDIDSSQLAFALESGPAGMSLNGNIVSWRPSQTDANNSYPVNVSVSDGLLSSSQLYQLEVIDINYPPVFVSQPVTEVLEDGGYEYPLVVTDLDNDALVLSLRNSPAGMTIEGNVIKWQPKQVHVGAHDILVEASDGTVASTQGFMLRVVGVNDLPVITSLPVVSAKEGDYYSYQVTATDEDGDELSYRLEAAPFGMTVSGSGLVEWIPGFESAGQHSVRVVVDDATASVAQEFVVTVANINRAPSAPVLITPLNRASGLARVVILDWEAATDLDGDSLRYDLYLGKDPASLSRIGVDLDLTEFATAELDYATRYYWYVAAKDGLAEVRSEQWEFTTESAPNRPPVADAGSDQSVEGLALVSLDGSASQDPEGSPLTFLWTQVAGSSVELSSNTIATPTFVAPDIDATLEFELVVSDGSLSAADRVRISVKALSGVPQYPSNYVTVETQPTALNGIKDLPKLFDGDTNTLGLNHDVDRGSVTVIMEYNRPFTLNGFKVHMMGPELAASTNYRVFAADSLADLRNRNGSFRVVKDFTISNTGTTELVFSTPHKAKVFGVWSVRTIFNGYVYLSEITPQ